MKIRLFENKDFDDIIEIEYESFVKPWTRENWQQEILTNPINKVFVMEDDDRVVGFVDFWITFDSATIAQIAVKKEFRKKGIAEALYYEMEKFLLSLKTEFLTLEVRVSNIPAQKLYEKVGFKKIVIKPQYYDNGEDAIYMVKELLCLQS